MKRRLFILLFIISAGLTWNNAAAQYTPAYNAYVRTLSWSGNTWYTMQWGDATGLPNFPVNYSAYWNCNGVRCQYKGQWTDYSLPIVTTYAILQIVGTTYSLQWPLYYFNGFTYINYLTPAP